jgi:cytochrome c
MMRRRRRRSAAAACSLLLALAAACRDTDRISERGAAETFAGDPERGRALLRSYGCQTCHTIPGVVGANAIVGPPLAGIASRSYIGGVLPNEPDNMIRWIENPRAVDSQTAMPNVGVTPSDARHIAAYLYRLR